MLCLCGLFGGKKCDHSFDIVMNENPAFVDSAAKRAGLVVGDRLVTVNGFNVLKEDAQFVTKLVSES